MGRINIEDNIESKDEFWKLLPLVGGDRDRALGKLVRFFRLALKAFSLAEGHIDAQELQDQGLWELVESGWALPYEGGYQVRQPHKHFGWYAEKKKASKAGGEANRLRFERLKKAEIEPTGYPADSLVEPNDSSPTPAPALIISKKTSLALGEQNFPTSSSKPQMSIQAATKQDPSNIQALLGSTNEKHTSKTQAELNNLGVHPPNPISSKTLASLGSLELVPARNETGTFIAAYARAFQKRYGPKARPDLRGKVQGQIKNFLKDYPIERAVHLIEAYCQMDGHRSWFKTKGHDFGTFVENLNPVSIALERGDPSGNAIDWSLVFDQATT